jgi:pyridinium-3,5-biscarboxylic acid mononucleotide sulfurtransferase
VFLVKKDIREKYARLQHILRDMKSCVVAYSGGMDSTFLAKVAYDVLGKNALAVTATSSTYQQRELADAKRFAKQIGIQHIIIQSEELDISNFSKNPPDRCYFCKKELFRKIREIADDHRFSYVLDGSTVDDITDYRPGSKASVEAGITSPLRNAGLTKHDIRDLSKYLHLESAGKPAMACLASRFPYGVKITKERLNQIGKAEEFLTSLGVSHCRVRYHNDTARIEVAQKDFKKIMTNRDAIVRRFKKLGFIYVTLDIEGYRTGSLNEVLQK